MSVAVSKNHDKGVHKLVIFGHMEHPHVMCKFGVCGIQFVSVNRIIVSIQFFKNTYKDVGAGENGDNIVNEEQRFSIFKMEVVVVEEVDNKQIEKYTIKHIFRFLNYQIVLTEDTWFECYAMHYG